MTVRSVARAGLVGGVALVLAGSLITPAVAAPPVAVRKDRWPVVTPMRPAATTVGASSPTQTAEMAKAMPGRGPAARSAPVGESVVDLAAAGGADQRRGHAGLWGAAGLDVWIGPVDAPSVREQKLPTPAVAPPTGAQAKPARAPRVTVTGHDPRLAEQLGVERVVTLSTGSTEPGPAQAVAVQVDTGFLDGVSGDVKARAVLVGLPACAVTTPQRVECQTQTPLVSARDPQANTLTATTMLAAAQVVAVVADAGGETGNFAATPIAASGSWTAGGSSGDFDWKLPIELPGVAGSPAASVEVAYSAQSVDGRTAAQNNQTSWIGEGWDSTQGFIERKYKSCAEDQTGGSNASTKTGDLCWFSDNFTVALGSHSGELVQDGTSDRWRLRRDDGTRFEHLFGAFGNGDDNNEYWKMTTTDGTQFFFGRGKPNASGQATNSTWTVPVFGNQPGEPCYHATYAHGWCVQAWRWNLDYVIEPHQGSMSIYYAAETNTYGLNNNTTPTSYTRGGYPVRIDYGHTVGQEHTSPAPARVIFEVAERCLPTSTQTCAEQNLSAATKGEWPDVPFDRICAGATCSAKQSSPAFFTRKRLTQIRTEVQVNGAYQEVEHWRFTHTFPNPGDGYAPALWLAGVSHGAPGMPEDPPTTFAGDAFANRVEGTTDSLGTVWGALRKFRIVAISNGMGGETLVFYSLPDCTGTSIPAPESNTRRCYPVWWTPTGETQPRLQWFHKYVVTRMDDYDRSAASSGHKLTSYLYQGMPGWGWDDSPLTKDSERTWGRWVGYGLVKTLVGDPNSHDALRTDTRYFRGLDQDRATTTGGAKSVTVPDSQGGSAIDHRSLQGMTREQVAYLGTSDVEVSGTITDYTILAATATNGQGRKAERGVPTHTKTRTAISGGRQRWTESFTRYDSFGMPEEVEDRGDIATATDDTCTRTTYARNTITWQLTQPATTGSRAVGCAGFDTLALTEDNVLADTRVFYDGLPLGQIGTGDATRTETATGLAGGQLTYAAASAGYDSLGRIITATDVLGRTATTAYTPAGRGPVTQTQATTPDPDGPGPLTAHTVTTINDPRLGGPVKQIGVGGEVTEAAYDGYGRVIAVWQPGRDKATQSPSAKYAYTIRADGPNAVTTHTLHPNGVDYLSSVALSDGLGRAVQTQTQSMDQAVDANGNVSNQPGRLVATTRYDLRGLSVAQQQPTFTWGLPDATIQHIDDAVVDQVTKTTFDGAGRAIKATLWSKNVEKWSTHTVYEGDRTHVTPPPGGTATTTITDARGQTTAVRQYTGAPLSTGFDETRYSYTPAGKIKTHTDPAGNTWSYTYNLQGHQIASDDPDTGRSRRTYDVAGQLLTSTNATNETLAYTYDQLGRKTSLRDDSATGAVRASWDYDTLKKGQATSATRWLDGKPIVSKVTGYDTASRPTGAQIVVPEIPGWLEAPLAKTYTTAMTYTPGGSPATTTLSGYGPLSFEKFNYTYDAVGRPLQLGGRGAYVINTIYSGDNKLMQLATGNTPGHTAWMSYTYDEATHRKATARFDREIGTRPDAQLAYTYNPAGNLTKLATATPETGTPSDTQCYDTDHLDRLTRAWTPRDGNCDTPPTITGLGGPAPYWLDWSFDKASNRTSETSHTAAGEATSTWMLPAGGTGPKPHQATSQTIRRPGQPEVTSPISYDPAGNVIARTTTPGSVPGQPAGATAQTLGYNREGRLDTLTHGAETVRFAYHVDGERLIRRDNTTTVLSLGDTELTLTRSTGVITPKRYIQFAGHTVAMRTSSNDFDVYTLWSDLNNTAAWQVANTTSTVTAQRTTPYGAPRDPATRLASDRGFVQGLNDPTLGMIRIGARDYDPATGRFLQPDPVLDTTTSSTQWNPYSYGDNNPGDHPDPSGLRRDDFTPEMQHAENRGRDPYDTPSGRAGGETYKSWRGLDDDRYEAAKRTTWDYTKRYKAAPRSKWGIVDQAYRRARAGDAREAARAKNARAAVSVAKSVGRALTDPYDRAFKYSPMNSNRAVEFGALDGYEQTLADQAFNDAAMEIALDVVTMQLSRAIAVARTGARVAKHGDTVVDLYRRVSPEELASLRRSGSFSAGKNSLEGKWFAESASDAQKWGERMYGGSGSIVRVRVPASIAGKMEYRPKLDGIGPARYAEDLNTLNSNIIDLRVIR